MSTQIPTHFIRAYESRLRVTAQQEDARFRGASVEKTGLVGEEFYFDYVGEVVMTEIASRHSDTPRSDTPHTRRRVTKTTFAVGDMIDTPDKLMMQIDPAQGYHRVQAASLNRRHDQTWIDAYYGTAFTGKNGATSVVFPAGNELAVAASGLTKAKIQDLRRLLRANEADTGRLFMAIGSQQIDDLFNISELTSIDQNSVKPLVDGKVAQWMGFTFIPTELLPLSSGDRRCPAWSEFGMGFAIWEDVFVRESERADKNYNRQIYTRTQLGATRLEENRCFSALCDE